MAVAPKLNAVQMAIYPSAKLPEAAAAPPLVRRERSIIAKSRIIGAALGNIMAAIMIAHINSIIAA